MWRQGKKNWALPFRTAMRRNYGESRLNLQAHHADKFFFPRVFFTGAVVEGFLQELKILAKLHLPQRQAAQGPESFFLLGIEFARLPVNHTECAQRKTVFVDEGRPSVKTDVRLTQYHRIVFEARVFQGVWDDEEVFLLNGVRAKRSFFGGFPDLHANL